MAGRSGAAAMELEMRGLLERFDPHAIAQKLRQSTATHDDNTRQQQQLIAALDKHHREKPKPTFERSETECKLVYHGHGAAEKPLSLFSVDVSDVFMATSGASMPFAMEVECTSSGEEEDASVECARVAALAIFLE